MPFMQELKVSYKEIKLLFFLLLLSTILHQVFRPLSPGTHWLDNVDMLVNILVYFYIGWTIGKNHSNAKKRAFGVGFLVGLLLMTLSLIMAMLRFSLESSSAFEDALMAAGGYVLAILIFLPLFGLLSMIGAIAAQQSKRSN